MNVVALLPLLLALCIAKPTENVDYTVENKSKDNVISFDVFGSF